MKPITPDTRLGTAKPAPLRAEHTISQQHVQLAAHRPVRVQPLDVTQDVRPHDHDYYEICLVRSGSAWHRTEHFELPFQAGSVTVLPPRRVHAMERVKDLRVTNIYYLAEWLLADLQALNEQEGIVPLFLAANLFRRNELSRAAQVELTPLELRAALRELDDLSRELDLAKPSPVYLRAAFQKFLIQLCRARNRAERSAGREPGFEFRPEIRQALEWVEEFVEEGRVPKVGEWAEKLQVSSDHFTKLFRAATGYAPLEYFQRRRVQHACRLLLNPACSVTEASLSLGFSDTAHLSRIFRRFQGCSPREYRNMYLK